MGETIGKLRVGGSGHFFFWCPGCEEVHWFRCNPNLDPDLIMHPNWEWNGDYFKPTITPSIHVNASLPAWSCHFHITDGLIAFCDDCWHPLRGTTVDLPDFPFEV